MTSRKRPAKTSSAVIYLRVSTAGQAESGLGLEAQEAACRAFCEAHGWDVVIVHRDEGFSGTLPLEQRPGLAAAVAACKAHPGAAFVVYSVSRVARSQRQLWSLVDERGDYALPIVSASEPFDVSTAAGRAFLGMLATFAALESDLASERTTAALAAAKARGTKLGAPSMGDMAATRPEVASALARVRELRDAGLSLRDVADRLNEERVPTAKGDGRWWPKTVRAALASATK